MSASGPHSTRNIALPRALVTGARISNLCARRAIARSASQEINSLGKISTCTVIHIH